MARASKITSTESLSVLPAIMHIKELSELEVNVAHDLVKKIGLRRAAKQLGVNGKTLRGALVKYGKLEIKDIPPQVLRWADMRAQGLSYKAIADRFEMSRQSIHGALTYWGMA